jgi:hypothetical protein
MEQLVEGYAESIAPALDEMTEQRLLVGEQPILTGRQRLHVGLWLVGTLQVRWR